MSDRRDESVRSRGRYGWAAAALVSALSVTSPPVVAAQCFGDCRGDGRVSVDDLLVGVNINLARAAILSCPAFDDGSGSVRIGGLVTAVRQSLDGCSAPLPSWTQPGYASTHDSYNPLESTITAGNVAALAERWRVDVGDSVDAPVLAAGRIFVTAGDENGDERVLALAARDGREIWRQSFDGMDVCCSVDRPVLTPDGKLTVAVGAAASGGLHRFDVASGESSGDLEFQVFVSNLAVRGDEEFALHLSFGSGGPFLQTMGRYLVSFSSDFSPPVRGPTVAGNLAFVGIRPNGAPSLMTFDLTRCPGGSNPGCGSIWAHPLPGGAETPVAFADAVAAASTDGTLAVYDAATGDLRWSGSLTSGIEHPPAVAHERIFQPDADGFIHAFAAGGCDDQVCEPVGSFALGAPIAAQPVVAGDVLYAGTEDGHLVAFAAGCDADPCAPLWEVDTGGGAVTAGPIVTGGMLFAGTADGTLLAYALP